MKFLTIFLITFFTATAIDYSILTEKSVGVQINGAEELLILASEKSFFSAGEGILGYNSKLSVKGEESVTKIKAGSDLIFYVKGANAAKNFTFSIVKMNIVKGKRVALSKTGMTEDKDIKITSIPLFSKEVDLKNHIFKVTLNKHLTNGVWCANFRRVVNGKFPIGSGYGKEVFCFEIIE